MASDNCAVGPNGNLLDASQIVTAKTFCGIKTAKAVFPFSHRVISQGVLPLSTSSGPLLSANVREEGIVKCYC